MARKSDGGGRARSARALDGVSRRIVFCRSTGGPGRPRRRRGCAPGTRRASRCWTRSAPTTTAQLGLARTAPSAGLPRPDRRAKRVGARRRAQHRVHARATCSSARRARRSGGTTRSSSARWSSGRRPTRCDDARPHGRGAAGRVRRAGTRALRSTDVDGAMLAYFEDAGILDLSRPGEQGGHAIGLRNHGTPIPGRRGTRPSSRERWSSRSSRGVRRRLGGFRHSDTVVVRDGRNRGSHGLPERPRRPDDPALTPLPYAHTPRSRGRGSIPNRPQGHPGVPRSTLSTNS